VASDIPVHREAALDVGSADVTFVSPSGSPLDVAEAIRAGAAAGVRTTLRLQVPTWEEVVARTAAVYMNALGEIPPRIAAARG
jgi:hypothetical protein